MKYHIQVYRIGLFNWAFSIDSYHYYQAHFTQWGAKQAAERKIRNSVAQKREVANLDYTYEVN